MSDPETPERATVERWKFIKQAAPGIEVMHGHPDGQWVFYSDYEALSVQLDAMKAENRDWQKRVEADERVIGILGRKIETAEEVVSQAIRDRDEIREAVREVLEQWPNITFEKLRALVPDPETSASQK